MDPDALKVYLVITIALVVFVNHRQGRRMTGRITFRSLLLDGGVRHCLLMTVLNVFCLGYAAQTNGVELDFSWLLVVQLYLLLAALAMAAGAFSVNKLKRSS